MWRICFLLLKGPLSAERWRQVDSQVDMHLPYSPPRAFSPKAEPHPRAHLSVRIEMPLTRPPEAGRIQRSSKFPSTC